MIFQVRKLRYKIVKSPVQSHTTNQLSTGRAKVRQPGPRIKLLAPVLLNLMAQYSIFSHCVCVFVSVCLCVCV